MTLYLGNNLISGVAYPTEPTRNLGQIIESIVPLTDAGLHLLDGALINGSGIYSAFVDYIADLYDGGNYPNLFETEANWQSAVSTYGVCGKFVYDSVNNTVRLPKYNSKIYTGGGTAPVVGNGMSLGLTNGTQNAGLYSAVLSGYAPVSSSVTAYGVNVPSNLNMQGFGTFTNSSVIGITTDSTKSGIEAQLSNITTSLDGYYYIVIATSTKTDIEVDIDEIATDLNGKADVDLININSSCKALDGQWVLVLETISSATAIGTYTIDISSYLPSDNYLYEVEISQQALGNNGTSVSVFSTAYNWTRGIYNAGTTFATTSNILCVGADRKITMTIGQVAFQTNSVTLGSYRRIGTNQ